MATHTTIRRHAQSRSAQGGPAWWVRLCTAFAIFAAGAWAGWALSLSLLLKGGADDRGAPSPPRITEESPPGQLDAMAGVNIFRELKEFLTSERLQGMAKRLHKEYKNAYPFPHVVIDDLFPQSVLDALLEELPESLVGPNGCYPKHELCNRATKTDRQYLKSSIFEEEELGPNTLAVLMYMKSGTFIQFLKKLTGISRIVTDPIFNGGGAHLTAVGGKLDLHADFNSYPGPRLDRRVNTFLFLNPNWEEEYGGHLELWSKDMKSCGQRIFPSLGRFVVFSTSDFSHHGHPQPLSAPPGRVRRSLALYYYTVGRPKEECLDMRCPEFGKQDGWHTGHATLWKEPVGCSDCLDAACNALPQ